MEEYCPAHKMEALMDILICGGYSTLMNEASIENGFDCFEDDHPNMPKEQRVRKSMFEVAHGDVLARAMGEDLFRYCSNTQVPELWDKDWYDSTEEFTKIDAEIRKNLGRHVEGCEDCQVKYLRYLFNDSESLNEWDDLYYEFAPKDFEKILRDRVSPETCVRLLEADSQLLRILKVDESPNN